jgi:hypothetical protein
MNGRTKRRIGIGAALAAVAMAAATSAGSGAAVHADPGSALQCPPFGFVSTTNLVKDPSFETIGPKGSPTTWHQGDPTPPPSAAAKWFMHTSNDEATVTSELVPTTVPGPGGTSMLHFIAGGNEGGVYQQVAASPPFLMFSVWVYVKKGHVVIQGGGGTSGPASWSIHHNQWEQLRVCTDGTITTGYFLVENEDPNGGDFYVDRAEVYQSA